MRTVCVALGEYPSCFTGSVIFPVAVSVMLRDVYMLIGYEFCDTIRAIFLTEKDGIGSTDARVVLVVADSPEAWSIFVVKTHCGRIEIRF